MVDNKYTREELMLLYEMFRDIIYDGLDSWASKHCSYCGQLLDLDFDWDKIKNQIEFNREDSCEYGSSKFLYEKFEDLPLYLHYLGEDNYSDAIIQWRFKIGR